MIKDELGKVKEKIHEARIKYEGEFADVLKRFTDETGLTVNGVTVVPINQSSKEGCPAGYIIKIGVEL